MELIKQFGGLGKDDADIAGGKGASLGEMTQAGIPVPPGFVVLSSSFEHFLKETDLNVEIDAIIDTVKHEEMHTVEHASEKIQGLILNSDMPENIKAEILSNFKKLGAEYVAVRSSATAEDSASAAWAGQLDSFLNTTEATLLQNVRRCWASLFTPRAIFYRFEKELHKQKISVAVVVQKMINSEKSGIAFSVHPVTEDRNQLIIEAGFGLGEAIVSGTVTPDSYVVTKTPREILDINVSSQGRALYRVEGGGNEWKDLGAQGDGQVLNEIQIKKLSDLIIKIEDRYGFPCDIEWAFESDTFYITQSRPITTLSEKFGSIEPYLLAQQFIDEMNGAKSIPPLNNYSLFIFGSGYNKAKYNQEVFKNGTPYPIINIRYQDHTQTFLSENAWKSYAAEVFELYLKDIGVIKTYEDNFYKNFPVIDSLYEKYTYGFISKQNEEDLLPIIEQDFNLFWTTNGWSHFSVYFDIDLCYSVVQKVSPNTTKADIESIWHNATDMVAESFDKAQKRDILNYIHNNPGLDIDVLIEHCQYFLTTYKNVSSLDKVKEDITKNYESFINNPIIIIDELERMDEELNAKKHQFETWKENLTGLQKNVADFCQIIMRVRDERKNHFAKGITIAWRIAEKLFAAAKVDAQLIENILPFEELIKGSTFIASIQGELIRRNKEYVVYVPYEGNTQISYENIKENYELMNSYFIDDHNDQSEEIKGQIGNKGSAKGRVKIIRSSQEFDKFENGEILVTGMTRPEFVSLMRVAKAVITDEGGITCHAAIVSRELGIPCVIGTKIATQVLKDGDLVEVDADNGLVRIIN